MLKKRKRKKREKEISTEKETDRGKRGGGWETGLSVKNIQESNTPSI